MLCKGHSVRDCRFTFCLVISCSSIKATVTMSLWLKTLGRAIVWCNTSAITACQNNIIDPSIVLLMRIGDIDKAESHVDTAYESDDTVKYLVRRRKFWGKKNQLTLAVMQYLIQNQGARSQDSFIYPVRFLGSILSSARALWPTSAHLTFLNIRFGCHSETTEARGRRPVTYPS